MSFPMVAVVTLERGDGSAVEALRRYAAPADEIGASGVDADDTRVDLLVPGDLVAVDLEHAMRALAGRLLRRFGWADDDLLYASNLRSAQTADPPSGPPATALLVERADQYLGHEGETHGLDVAPARTLEVAAAGPLARLFVTVPATTVTEALDALEPWLARTEPAALGLDRADGHFRAGLLWPARGDLATETARLGLAPVDTTRIEAGTDHLIEIATTADGTGLWLRRDADPISPYWPGLLDPQPMKITHEPTGGQAAALLRTLSEMFDRRP